MPPLLAGLTILMIGDSHLTFKNTLLAGMPEAFVAQGAKVVTYGLCSSKPEDWVDEKPINACGYTKRIGTEHITLSMNKDDAPPNIQSLVQQWHPDAVIVVFGDAMAGYSQSQMPADWIKDQVHALVDNIGSAKCIWVGPTWGRYNPRYGKTDARTVELAGFLEKETQPCHYIDSTKILSQNSITTEDGLHLTTEDYKKWSTALVKVIDPLLTTDKK